MKAFGTGRTLNLLVIRRCLCGARRRGVTFFELAVVFIVIAVLVAVIVIGTRRLTVETKLTRAREEHRVISRALQNYHVDFSSFPIQSQGLDPLSEPVTYLAHIPYDIFAKGEEGGEPYAYRTYRGHNQVVWLLVSRGPDADLDFDTSDIAPVIEDSEGLMSLTSNDPPPTGLRSRLLQMSYDPTNGLHSNGDVITLSPFAPR